MAVGVKEEKVDSHHEANFIKNKVLVMVLVIGVILVAIFVLYQYLKYSQYN